MMNHEIPPERVRFFLISLAVLISLIVAGFVSATARAILREPLEMAKAVCVLYSLYRFFRWIAYGESLESARREQCDGCGLYSSSLADFWLCHTCWQRLKENSTMRN
jgi:hypothetical protein